MRVAAEHEHVVGLFADVRSLESVAASMGEQDARYATLTDLIGRQVGRIPPVRPSTAAELLGLSEPTVRAWVREGVLTAVATKPRLLLDPERLRDVMHAVQVLRDAGQTQGLLDPVFRRLVDETWAERADLAESMEQMRHGEGTLRRSASA